jgi:hypothetical protein
MRDTGKKSLVESNLHDSLLSFDNFGVVDNEDESSFFSLPSDGSVLYCELVVLDLELGRSLLYVQEMRLEVEERGEGLESLVLEDDFLVFDDHKRVRDQFKALHRCLSIVSSILNAAELYNIIPKVYQCANHKDY